MAEPNTDISSSLLLGSRLKQLREQLGLSQRALARSAGLTNATLSMIEQGRTSPTLVTLERILQALSFNITEFFAHPLTQPSPVISQTAWLQQQQGNVKLRCLVTPQTHLLWPLLKLDLPPKSQYISSWPQGVTWVTGVIDQGCLTLWLDHSRWTAQASDGFNFQASRHHKFENLGEISLQMTLSLSR